MENIPEMKVVFFFVIVVVDEVSFELKAFHALCVPKIGVRVYKFYVNGHCNLMLNITE